MNIAVYCGAADGNEPSFLEAARTLGDWIAKKGHRLIYGAGKVGMMGAVADAVLSGGGAVTGVIPQFMVDLGWCHDGLTELKVTEDMSSRIKQMCELSDAMIALPGGAGTLEEMAQMISWSRLGLNDSPCVFFNCNGFYDPLLVMYGRMVELDFLERESVERLLFTSDMAKIEEFIMREHRKGRTATGGYRE